MIIDGVMLLWFRLTALSVASAALDTIESHRSLNSDMVDA